MIPSRIIRVLIVEDSRVNQLLLKGILADDPCFEIVGIANNGAEAVDLVSMYKPDVVSMDIYMPEMDGVEATRRIMQSTPVPIVIISSFYNASEVKMSFSILEAGALTILPRPNGPGHAQYLQTARNYRNTLKMMADVKIKPLARVGQAIPKAVKPVTPIQIPGSPAMGQSPAIHSDPSGSTISATFKIIAIGASAGGPQVIQEILKEIPSSLPVPVLIVQHIDANFAEGYCDWLAINSNLPVRIAKNGEKMEPGHVYLPPGDHHLGLISPGIIAVSKAPPEKSLRPSVSVLFNDVLKVYGKNSIAIILSGMGTDGAAGLKLLHDCGAYTIAQDAKSSLVHGMPGEAIRIGGASTVLGADEIVKEIIKLMQL